MALDEVLLGQARAAGRKLGEAERAVDLARADYHTAVRRLHLGGGSLREIAGALELSHQRVQQIVSGAGGSWWRRVWSSRTVRRDAVCTFCGKPPSEVARLVAGPDVYVCDGCIARADHALAGQGEAGLERVDVRRRAKCSFCGKGSSAALPVVRADAASVCRDCLALCRELVGRGSRDSIDWTSP